MLKSRENEMEPKKRELTFSLESISNRIILLVVLGIIGGPGVIGMVVPTARPLAFTTEDGIVLKTEIRRECQANLAFMQSEIDDMQEQVEEIENIDAALLEKYYEHSHEAPPQWVKENLLRLEKELIEVRRRMQ